MERRLQDLPRAPAAPPRRDPPRAAAGQAGLGRGRPQHLRRRERFVAGAEGAAVGAAERGRAVEVAGPAGPVGGDERRPREEGVVEEPGNAHVEAEAHAP